MQFPSIDIQGNIISTDLLSRIRSEQATYQLGKDFGNAYTNAKLKEEISMAWQDVKGQWTILQSKLNRLKEGELGTTETRNFWITPLLTNLGYNLSFNRNADELNGKSFYINSRDTQLDNFPIIISGYHQSLDRRPENKQLRVSPHAMLQEYLNYSEHLYGIVTNGKQLRLLRDASRLTRLSYVEFNLEKMVEEDLYSDFVILYRLLHASRMPQKMDSGADSIIEKYHQEGLEAGSTIRSKLGEAVKQAIISFANGFLNHPNNTELRNAVSNGTVNPNDFYHHQLRIIYRLLFLFVIEERNLVYGDNKTLETKRFNSIYHNYYSLLRLRKLAKKLLPPEANRNYDLWQSLVSTFSLFEKKEIGEKLGIMCLQGDLFGYNAISTNNYDLHQCYLSNATLLTIIKSLTYFENENRVLITVNYGGLDVEEFGSVYEGLLELKLNLKQIEGSTEYSCSFDTSNERSKSGSHYTPEELVQPLIKHSLDYLIEDRKKEKVNGDWKVVSAKYPELKEKLNNLLINLWLEYEELSRFGSLEKGYGFSSNDIPIKQLLSKRRIVWNDFSTPQVGKFNTGKYSGGLGTQREKGIQSVSENSKREFEGNRNAPDSGSKAWSDKRPTIANSTGNDDNIGQANIQLAKINFDENQYRITWHLLPEPTRQSLFTTHHLLNLKICDVACGSGHILLSAARRLALEIARVQTDEDQPNPMAIRKAIKQVIRQCIYGVDKNPLAVELCKVALWLESYNPNEPLNFLDHHIKCGDAIVGLAHQNELENGIANEAFKALPADDKVIAKAFRDKNSKEREQKTQTSIFDDEIEDEMKTVIEKFNLFAQLPEHNPDEIATKEKQYRKFEGSVERIRLKQLADTQVAQFFIPKNTDTKDVLLTDNEYRNFLRQVHKGMGQLQSPKLAYATTIAQPRRFFHWFIEFPEVFSGGGFDCILGNPPFLGGQKLSGNYGDNYLEYIKYQFAPIGAVDLVTYFFKRIFDIIKEKGFQSLISTNTIAQGGSREFGLDEIVKNGGSINHAIKSMRWPGKAAVEVALVTITKQTWKNKFILSGKEVKTITPYLDDSEVLGNPFPLKQNAGKSFQGCIVLGKGFILTPEQAESLIAKDPRNKDVLFPYLNGDDLNNDPEQKPSRWVINFFDWSEEKARTYPDCFEIVEKLVKPERMTQNDKGGKEQWWHFLRPRNELYKTISKLDQVMVVARISKTLAMCFINKNLVFADALVVFNNNLKSIFSIMQSSIHNNWSWMYCTTMKSDLNYTPGNTFETFPFPEFHNNLHEQRLESVGQQYHEQRIILMQSIQLGLTKTYNLFHCEGITVDSINENDKQVISLRNHLRSIHRTIPFDVAVKELIKLRDAHVAMDNAVVEAYNWQDIPLLHNFYKVEYLPENDRVRFTIHPNARKEILKRLLQLNQQLYKTENGNLPHAIKSISNKTEIKEIKGNILF